MDHQQLTGYKKRLEKEKDEVIAILERIAHRVGHSDVYAPSTANFGDDVTEYLDEEADEAEEFSNRIGVVALLTERLRAISAAMAKIKRNIYGVCERCKNPISHDVLHAMPASALCKECKKSPSESA